MTTESLARLLMEKKGWSYGQLAKELGIRKQVAHTLLTSKSEQRRTGFHVGVLITAMRHGFEAEVLSILLNKEVDLTSTVRASIAYTDLLPIELEKIQEVEKVLNQKPLPLDMIHSIVKTLRSA